MFPEQRIFCVPVMIERDGFPALFDMTLFTIHAEVGAVNVVLFVTGVTVR
jgi:hypothetical protein